MLTNRSPRSRFILLIVAVAALALTLGACGSSSKGGSSATADITIKDFAFTTVTSVKAGATANDGKSFDQTVDPGKTITFTAPATAGTYPFHCSIHTQMKSKLVVT